METELPERFLGTYKLERSENFDEYLGAKGFVCWSRGAEQMGESGNWIAGVPWLVRKLILASSMTRTLATAESGGFVHNVVSARKNISARFPSLCVPAPMQQMDGKTTQVTYRLDGDALVEEMQFEDGSQDRRTFTRDGDYLVHAFRDDAKDISCKQYFKKT